ncbi:MAG: T9SS type A sorting domain-containing protein [Saprospiraceae bacterium]|nr:T9SS type A sorting domain-containing protein [Saprospiraceae bacterium]
MRVLFTLLCIVQMFVQNNFGQERNCGTMEVLDRQIKENPSMLKNMDEIERQVQEYIRKHPNGSGERTVITIPTVFHVVYRTATENISDAQVQSQIAVLNADFKALNSDIGLTPSIFQGVIGNVELEFCLATQTPSGNSTNGITRTSTTVSSWGTNDNVKRSTYGGVNPWNPSNYLNIWVCNIGGGVLGYAQFPGGPATTDGVVLDYRYTGTLGTATAPYHKGRTATHEVGHWLNLRHIWGDANCGSDLVSDTPVHNTANGGCPAYPHYSTCSGAPVEMTMNYMDYTYDACMYMFSQGQKTRMRAVLEGSGSRSGLQNSPGCMPVDPNQCNAPSGLSTTNITAATATSGWSAVANAINYTYEYKTNAATIWTAQDVSGTSVNLTGLTSSTAYNTRVKTNCSAGSSVYSATVNFTTTAPPPPCPDQYENNNTSNSAKTISIPSSGTASINAKIGTSADVDWFKFKNSNSKRNIRVNLTGLTQNYDVALFRKGDLNTPVGISQNSGTADEQIIFNNTLSGTDYYIKIYGVDGAFDNNICYNLSVTISSSSLRVDNHDEQILPLNELIIYPNPASDEITVVVPFGNQKEGILSILDITGKVVNTQKLTFDKSIKTINMDVSQFKSGMYVLNFRTLTDSYTRKLAITDK